MKDVIFQHLSKIGKLPTTSDAAWSTCGNPTSPLLNTCPDGRKQIAMPGILAWYANKGIHVRDEQVYFFDDRSSNVQPFASERAFNAKQVSCATRDNGGSIGLCGATRAEI